MSDNKLKIVCSGCGAKMLNYKFDMHECPNSVEPLEGESWEDYSKRCEEFKSKKAK